MDYIREKLGRKKKVRLPNSLTVQAPASGGRGRQAARVRTEPEAVQISMDMMPEDEEMQEPPASEGQNP